MRNIRAKDLFLVKQAAFERSYFIPGSAEYLILQGFESIRVQIYYLIIVLEGKN